MTSEAQIVDEIWMTLGRRTDVRLWRQQVATATPIYSTRVVKFGVRGMADLSGILSPSGKRLELEVKNEIGQQSEHQRAWQAMIESMGGVYILARSAEDALEQLRKRGYCHDPS